MVNIVGIILIAISMGLLVTYYFMSRLYMNNEIIEKMQSKVSEHYFSFENVETKIIHDEIDEPFIDERNKVSIDERYKTFSNDEYF